MDIIQKKRFFNVIITTIVLLSVFLGVKIISGIKEYSQYDQVSPLPVLGTGEVFAVPDTGSFSFSVSETAKTVTAAQDAASKKINSIIAALKSMGVDEKDIKTENYSSYPKYEYGTSVCPRPLYPTTDGSASSYYCPPNKQVLTGYQVDQSISVKVRKVADAGTILTKVGSFQPEYISGLSFVVDDPDAVQAEARDKAIADAKAKAKVLAKSLGVKLGKILDFQEGNIDGYPIYYAKDAMAGDITSQTSVTPPETPLGQNKVTSTVTITYEIR